MGPNIGCCGNRPLLCAGLSLAQDDWPREVKTKEGGIIVYEPQLESFRGDKVNARTAISIRKKDAKEPVFGVVWFSARALTNRDTRTVEFTDVKIDKVKFPHSSPSQEQELVGFLEKDVGHWQQTPMSLDRLLALTAAIEREKVEATELIPIPRKSTSRRFHLL